MVNINVTYLVCDNCLNVAYDLGAYTLSEQQIICMELGADIADHICVVIEDPELNETCACLCQN